ncbi:MAG: hypothetical protein MZV63_18085 [Marinilabiliales bacterium]|nr:hypothetical protein [Marinilabiliales bacterium]
MVGRGHGPRASWVLALKEEEGGEPAPVRRSSGVPDGQGDLPHVVGARPVGARAFVRLDVTSKALDAARPGRASVLGVPPPRATARSFVFSLSDGDRPADLHAAPAGFSATTRPTDLNSVDGREGAAEVGPGVAPRRRRQGAVRRAATTRRTTSKGKTISDGLRGLRDVLRQRLQRPRGLPGEPRRYAVFHPSVNLVVGPARRGVGEGRHRGGQPAHRDGRGRSRSAGRARHELRRLRHGAAADADRSLQGGHQHLGQGGHGELLHRQPAPRRAQHARAREEPGPHRRHAVGLPGALPRALGRAARGPHHDAAAVHHGRPGPERARPASRARSTTRSAAREGGASGCATSTARTGRRTAWPRSVDFEQRILAWCMTST